MRNHNNEYVDILLHYLDHQLHNNTNKFYTHSALCMCRCVTKRHFSL